MKGRAPGAALPCELGLATGEAAGPPRTARAGAAKPPCTAAAAKPPSPPEAGEAA